MRQTPDRLIVAAILWHCCNMVTAGPQESAGPGSLEDIGENTMSVPSSPFLESEFTVALQFSQSISVTGDGKTLQQRRTQFARLVFVLPDPRPFFNRLQE